MINNTLNKEETNFPKKMWVKPEFSIIDRDPIQSGVVLTAKEGVVTSSLGLKGNQVS